MRTGTTRSNLKRVRKIPPECQSISKTTLQAELSHRIGYFLLNRTKADKGVSATKDLLLLKGRTILQSSKFRFLDGIFRSMYIRDNAQLFNDDVLANNIRHQSARSIRYLRSLQTGKKGKSGDIFFRQKFAGYNFQQAVYRPPRISAGSNELQSSAVENFSFNTTDYCCTRSRALASYKGSHFLQHTSRTLLLTESAISPSAAVQTRLLWYSSGRAYISDTLPKSNTRLE